jgi:multicomponent K+:H+ antiporter subunit D
MSTSVILPLLIPLFAAIITLFASHKSLMQKRVLSVSFMGLLFFAVLYALYALSMEDYLIYTLGNWKAPFGIVLVLDKLSILFLITTTLLGLGVLWYSIVAQYDVVGANFHPLFWLQIFGINGAFLTGDIFNLFVFFEILLLASYSLLLHGKGNGRTKAGLHYVIINLIGSTLFLFAVGVLYGIFGTLNIADLSLKISHMNSEDVSLVASAGLLLLVVFGLKAAFFPLYLWLPSAYSKTSAPIAALFAIMTKVGIYAIIRVHGTLFGSNAGELAFYYTPWVFFIGIITLIMATFGIMSAKELRGQIAYIVLASVATLLIAIGVNTHGSINGALYYVIHSTLLAGGFFLVADIIANSRGSMKATITKGPSFKYIILTGSLFFAFAIAMAGLPPFSGFIGKLMILHGSFTHNMWPIVFGAILTSSLLVVISLTKSGSQIFYDTNHEKPDSSYEVTMKHFYPLFFLATIAPIMVVFANPITTYIEFATSSFFDVTPYIKAVLGLEFIKDVV